MEAHPDVDILGTNFNYRHVDGKVFGFNFKLPQEHETIKLVIPFINIFVHSSLMIRRERVIEFLDYENLRFGADYYLWLNYLFDRPYLGLKFAIIPENLV